MARERKRRLVGRTMVCLFLGGVMTVAVAWGCAVFSPLPLNSIADWRTFGHWEEPDWEIPGVLQPFYSDYIDGMGTQGIGVTFYLCSANRRDPNEHSFTMGRAGFPLRCLRWMDDRRADADDVTWWVRGIETNRSFGTIVSTQRNIPLMPEPVGMFLNVLIFSAAIALVRVAWRGAVMYRRKRKSLCVTCAYPMDDFTICPECGNPTGRESRANA